MLETLARDPATPCSSLVCPLDLQDFRAEAADGLRCADTEWSDWARHYKTRRKLDK